MASAVVGPIKEQVRCSVCLQAFIDPHILTCLHTYCNQCIQGMTRRKRVRCPQCKRYSYLQDIGKDLNIETKTDNQTEGHLQGLVEEAPSVCDVEKEPGENSGCCLYDEEIKGDNRRGRGVLTSQVQRGDRYSVSERGGVNKEYLDKEDGHGESEVNKKQSLSVPEMGEQDVLEVIGDDSIKRKQEVHGKYKICVKKKERGKRINRIKINQNCSEKGRDDTEHTPEVADVISRGSKRGLSRSTEQVKRNQTMQVGDGKPYGGKTELSNSSGLKKVKQEHVSVTESDYQSIGGNGERSSNSGQGIEQKVDGEKFGPKLIHKKYDLIQSVDLLHYPSKVNVYGEELWVGGWDKGIFLYNLDLEQLRHIQYKKFKYVTSVVKISSGDLIVADGQTGLHQLTQHGHYMNQIAPGHFSDVSSYNDCIYALDFNKYVVIVFTLVQGVGWINDIQFTLQYLKGSLYDKLCITGTNLYITSAYSHCVQVYTLTGLLLFQTGASGHQARVDGFHGPVLGDVDSAGEVLVCGYYNQRRQVFCPQTGQWRELLDMLYESATAFASCKHLWVGTRKWPYKLLKYVATDA